jgi:hypothetical protein
LGQLLCLSSFISQKGQELGFMLEKATSHTALAVQLRIPSIR